MLCAAKPVNGLDGHVRSDLLDKQAFLGHTVLHTNGYYLNVKYMEEIFLHPSTP